MTPDEFLSAFRHNSTLIGEVLEMNSGDTLVPNCPGWTLDNLIEHTGLVHRWAHAQIEAAGEKAPFPTYDGTADDLRRWFLEGAENVGTLLSETSPDAPAQNFMGPGEVRFWFRRLAQETAIHRWDAQAASGGPAPIDAALAVDGINEVFELFARRMLQRDGITLFADELGRSLHLHGTDIHGEWMIQRNASGFDVTHEHGKGTTAIRGSASDLLLFLWGRADQSALEVFGDPQQLDEWQSEFNI